MSVVGSQSDHLYSSFLHKKLKCFFYATSQRSMKCNICTMPYEFYCTCIEYFTGFYDRLKMLSTGMLEVSSVNKTIFDSLFQHSTRGLVTQLLLALHHC